MLIFTRRPRERIMIGDNIVITIQECHKGQVRLGIDAPREISVDREEIYERKKAEANGSDSFGNR